MDDVTRLHQIRRFQRGRRDPGHSPGGFSGHNSTENQPRAFLYTPVQVTLHAMIYSVTVPKWLLLENFAE